MAPRIIIIGAGHAGLCLAINLKRAGFTDFVILEKGPRLGGTWRENTYPGAACDSPSFAYCFSFEQKTDWSRKWAPQPEILAYLEHCADAYGLRPHLRCDTEVIGARFDASVHRWRLETAAGETLEADILVSAVGQLNRPSVPPIPGLETFRGPRFHSANWDHAVPLEGKRVGVIGNAASAVQLVPAIAPRLESLRVFQRSANWMIEKNDRQYPAWEQALYARVPALARLYRWWLWLSYELRFPIIREHPFFTERATRMAHEMLEEQVPDGELRRRLTPDYPIGAKRVLISDDYYPALQRDNVALVCEPIETVAADAIITRDGVRHPIDILILATGFDSTSFLAPMRITGPDGRTLETLWSDGPEAYLGMSVAGLPNFFMMYGPNTNLGHNSIIFMIECQTRYILDCLRQMQQRGLAAIDLRPDVQQRHNRELARALEGTAWARVGRSWYKDARGRITNNWPHSTATYWWRTRRADLALYRLTPR